jgi:hypothetical protein
MKSAIALITLLLACTAAYAGTLLLQFPVKHFNPICGYAPVNEQTVTGFSADGNYILVAAHGYTSCGSSGRGATVSHVYWCEQLTFDLGGHLVNQTLLQPATYQGFNNCPWADPFASFMSAAGDIGYTTYNWNFSQTAPQLETP